MAKTGRAQRYRQVPMASKPPRRYSPAQPDSYHGHGEWLHCLPGKWETTLLDPVFQTGSQPEIRLPCPGHGPTMRESPPGGQTVANIFLTRYGQTCSHSRSDHQTCLARTRRASELCIRDLKIHTVNPDHAVAKQDSRPTTEQDQMLIP